MKDSTTDLDSEQSILLLRGIASAVRHGGELTPIQSGILEAVGKYILGIEVAAAELAPLAPGALADALSDEILRRRAVHGMTTLEIVMDPLPAEVCTQVDRYADALGVDEGMLIVARDYSKNAMDIAMADLFRNSYVAAYAKRQSTPIGSLGAPEETDPKLAAKWETLASCPSGSHGRAVWDFYQMRGFAFPGTPGAVSPLLAQHDWVHCLADYGTSATGEIEVFTFVASAIPDQFGFSYAVIILGLFETGFVAAVPGVATANTGHLAAPGGSTRFADALRRGLAMDLDVMGGIDWFQSADKPIDDVRCRLGVLPKGPDAVEAGSLSALDPRAVFRSND
jgi:hypothetical protein